MKDSCFKCLKTGHKAKECKKVKFNCLIVSMKRCIAVEGGQENVKHYLIFFFFYFDASVHAYAAAIYLLQTGGETGSKIDLLFSKTRLEPLKKITIPRLELMAVVIGVRCLRFVKQQIKLPIEGTHTGSVPEIRRHL